MGRLAAECFKMRIRDRGVRRSRRRNLAQFATLGDRIGSRPVCCNCLSTSVGLARQLADDRQMAIQPTISSGSAADG